jgi:hypothetical protein
MNILSTALLAAAALSSAAGVAQAQPAPSDSSTTTYHTVPVDRVRIFYREAGPKVRRPSCSFTAIRPRRGCSRR